MRIARSKILRVPLVAGRDLYFAALNPVPRRNEFYTTGHGMLLRSHVQLATSGGPSEVHAVATRVSDGLTEKC